MILCESRPAMIGVSGGILRKLGIAVGVLGMLWLVYFWIAVALYPHVAPVMPTTLKTGQTLTLGSAAACAFQERPFRESGGPVWPYPCSRSPSSWRVSTDRCRRRAVACPTHMKQHLKKATRWARTGCARTCQIYGRALRSLRYLPD